MDFKSGFTLWKLRGGALKSNSYLADSLKRSEEPILNGVFTYIRRLIITHQATMRLPGLLLDAVSYYVTQKINLFKGKDLITSR